MYFELHLWLYNNEPINIHENSSEIKFYRKTLSTANMKKEFAAEC
jgi:hypothetical protein